MNFRVARREPARVDLTPLIDIIFQLVLFFMVSTTFLATPGLEVELPRSSADAVALDEDDLSVWMTARGEIYVDDDPVTWEELLARMDAAARKNPRTTVIIKADTEVDHGRVVTVMDAARARGLTRLAIGTEGETRQGQGSDGSQQGQDN